MSNQKIISQILQNDPDVKEVVIRTGEARPDHSPISLRIHGNIDAPSRFIEVRKESIERMKSHCLVSKSAGEITLVNNEWSVEMMETITGKIELSKVYQSLGINNPNVDYTPKELAKKLKLLRAIFADRAQHAAAVKALNNFQAKVNQDLAEMDDRKGNKSVAFSQVVESNVPDSFTLSIPLIEGEDPVNVLVDVVIEAGSSLDVKCFLESADAAELVDESREKRVMAEVEKIEKHTTVIFI